MSTVTTQRPVVTDFNVRDLAEADFGRKEIRIAETRCPASWRSARSTPPQAPRRALGSSGSLHMTIQTAVLIETLVDLGADVRWCSCNIFSTQDHAAAAVVVPARHRGPPGSRASPGRARPSRSTGGAPSACSPGPTGESGPNMILDDGGDATMLVHKGAEFEKRGRRSGPTRTATPSGSRPGLLQERRQATPIKWPKALASRASPRRPPPASTDSTRWPRAASCRSRRSTSTTR